MPALVTLTAHLESILSGAALGGYLRITLCGIGPILPHVPGASLADATVPQIIGPQAGGGSISQLLWGNDQIVPIGTFYEIAILDAKKNVIQSGNFQFSQAGGAVTINLEDAVQIVPPYGFLPQLLTMKKCTGAIPGAVYVATGALLIVAVFYSGELIYENAIAPELGYTKVGSTITLNFATEAGDRIDALCVA